MCDAPNGNEPHHQRDVLEVLGIQLELKVLDEIEVGGLRIAEGTASDAMTGSLIRQDNVHLQVTPLHP